MSAQYAGIHQLLSPLSSQCAMLPAPIAVRYCGSRLACVDRIQHQPVTYKMSLIDGGTS